MTEDLTTAAGVRTAVREFLEANLDPDMTLASWLSVLADSGWAVPQWSAQWFGKGLSTDLALVAYDEFKKVDAVGPPPGLARMLAAPTIITHGTDEQKQRFVRAILAGEEAWCQLFSEPGAGSDLASLATRAELDGDEYVVNGQKVWTSGAVGADYGMLLARTDPDAPKHRGITWFAFEMDQPGVEVRPLKQITGESHFAEVFFTDARVPAANIVGGLNEGWAVGTTTLANERVGLGGGGALGFGISAPGGRAQAKALQQKVGEYVAAIAKWRESGRVGITGAVMAQSGDALARLAIASGTDKDPAVREQLARLYALNQLTRWNTLRAKATAASGGRPGPEGSLGKLMVSRIIRAARDAGMAAAGPRGMLAGEDGPQHGGLATSYLGAPAPSIYGGSDEIQHNIVGERVLGLPREPDDSKTLPFKELRTGTQK
ncbi:MAG TPA: acyl-CoA dehydrogenase family protein [Mycobacteriales bacterium]